MISVDELERQIQDRIRDRLESQHPGLLFIGAGVAGLLSFAALGPLGLLGVGLLSGSGLFHSHRRNQQAWEAFDRGDYEPLMTRRERLMLTQGATRQPLALPAADPDPLAFLGSIQPSSPVAKDSEPTDRPIAIAPTTSHPTAPIFEWDDAADEDDLTSLASIAINPAFIPDFEAKEFQWEWLKDRDSHPKLALIAPMGGGKSRLIRYLAGHILFDSSIGFDGVVYDICGRSNEWQNYTVVTEHGKMLSEMYNDTQAIASRLEQYRQGQDKFPPFLRVLEEAVDTLPTLTSFGKQAKELVDSWQRQFGSATRKLNALAVYVSTELVADAIGMSAGGRNSSTLIFPGTSGIALAMTDAIMLKLGSRENKGIRDQLNAKLAQCEHPALVYHQGKWYWASIPALNAAGDPMDKAQPVGDDTSQKLLNWLKGTGLKHSANGIYSPQAILSNFAFKRDGKTSRLTQEEAKQAIAILHQQGAIEITRENGQALVKLKEVRHG